MTAISKPAILGGRPVREPFQPHGTNIGEDEKRLVLEVLDSGVLSGFAASNDPRFYGGKMVREFERQFCEYFGVKYAVSFNSATSALHAAAAACGVGPGDEVITSPFTMSATPSSIIHANGIPIFADIEDRTYGLDPDRVAEKITQRTKGIVTVNLFGHPSRLNELRSIADEKGLFLIEDNSQSPYARYKGRLSGTIGEIGIFSLNYHKFFQCGEGGIAVTNREDLSVKMQLVRNHGEVIVDAKGIDDIVNTLGWNYRMTELQAAVAIPQLKKLKELIEWRSGLAKELSRLISRFDFLSAPITEDGCDHVYYLYPIRYHEERAGLSRRIFCEAIKAENFPVIAGYLRPLYLEPMYQKKIAYGTKGCPFSCPHYEGKVDYTTVSCSTAERLWKKELIAANFVKYPNSISDIHLFVDAVERIMNHKEDIIRWWESKSKS